MEDADFFDEIIYTLKGGNSLFHFSKTTVSLLHDIEKNIEKKSLAVGIVAAINGMHGALATSAMLSLYGGDDMYNFFGLVNGKVVCGVFEEADNIKDGDEVQVVGYKKGDEFIAVAVVDVKENKIWMQPHCERGTVSKNVTF